MRPTVRRALAAVALSGAALAAFAPAASAADIYHPVLRPCGQLFRTPLDPPRPGAAVYWSPFGTTDIFCLDDGTGLAHYLQRDPAGAWHYIARLNPDNFYYELVTTGLPTNTTVK